MSNTWSIEKTIKFLEIYEQYPCLWNIYSNSYRNKEKREEAYRSIAAAMHIDDFCSVDVRAKIRSLRNAYTLELAKILKSKRDGTYKSYIRSPKMAWFPAADKFFSKTIYLGGSPSKDTQLCSKYSNDSCIEIKESTIASQIPQENENHNIFGAFVATELKGLGNHTLVRLVKKKIQCAILDAYETHLNCSPDNRSLPSEKFDLSAQVVAHMEEDELKTQNIHDDMMLSDIKCSIIAAQSSTHGYRK